MQNRDMLLHPVETFRTAPYGSSMTAFSGLYAAWVSCAFDGGERNSFLAGSALFAMYGLWMTSRQIKLRNKIEKHIARFGYEDRVMAATTSEWCARQTVMVVLEDSPEITARYAQLCQERSEEAQLKMLPHVAVPITRLYASES